MSRYGLMQYPTSPTLWERLLDKIAGWLVGTLFRVDEALADLGGDD
jgi:hypothetical protein